MPGDRSADPDADRGLRAALLAIEELRGDVFQLAGRMVALEEELMRRVPEAERAAFEAALDARTPELVKQIEAADVRASGRVMMGEPIDKYAVPPIADGGPPCLELLPICGARCCSLDVPLTSQDLDEGIVRWDHGNPYLLKQEADRHCTHLSRSGAGCTCYQHRPAPCRQYDCRADRRIWVDYEKKILVPIEARPRDRALTAEQRQQHASERRLSLMVEAQSLRRPG
jgi:Fe-S-cluster containining protein